MFHYVTKIMSTGIEWYEDANAACDAKTIAENAVRNAKITTNRLNPKPCTVEVSTLTIKLGNVEKRFQGTVNVTPPFAPMTDVEYKDEMDRILFSVPAPFRDFIVNHAWQEGHSSGLEEVVSIANSLIAEVLPAIKAFEKELINNEQIAYNERIASK